MTSPTDVTADVGVGRIDRRVGAGADEHVPAAAVAPEQRGRAHPERGPQLAEHLGDRAGAGQRAGQRGQRLGLGLRAGGPHPAAPDPVDEHGDDAGGDDVDDEGEEVLAVGDVEPVVAAA